MNKKISIVVPYYNAHNFIEDLLFSIKKQTHREDCELIIVENGSTNESKDILNKKIDKYIKYFPITLRSLEKPSISDARNLGIELSKGEFITFIDADDIFAGRFSLEYRVDFLEKNPQFDVIGGYAIKMDQDGKVENSRAPLEVEQLYRDSSNNPDLFPSIYCKYYLEMQKIFFFITGSALIRNNKLKELNLKFDREFDKVEDVEFNISLFDAGLQFSLQKLPFYIKRSHENNTSKNTPEYLEQKIIDRIKRSKFYV